MSSGEQYKVKALHDRCEYRRFARFFIGKRIMHTEASDGHVFITFVFPDDRLPLNKLNGWSDNKTEYLLYKPTLEKFVRKKKQPSEWQPIKGPLGSMYERNCKGQIRLIKNK